MNKTNAQTNGVRPMTLKELAVAYGVSKSVIRTWLSVFMEDIGPRIGHVYNMYQVKTIYDRLGMPPITTNILGLLFLTCTISAPI